MARFLVLFAREPARQAREKGFGRTPDASLLFSKIAADWADAARVSGASLVISTPREDLPGWRQARGVSACDPIWMAQEGRSFAERLRDTAARAARFGGHAVIVGGDVPPRVGHLEAAFSALESGAEAVLAPAADGGVSLVALPASDLDLLSRISRRRRNVFSALQGALAERGRRSAVLDPAPDVDGRTALRGLLRGALLSEHLFRLGRRLLAARPPLPISRDIRPLAGPALVSPVLRGPPAAA